MEMTLSFEKDRSVLEEAFYRKLALLKEQGVIAAIESRTTDTGFCLHITFPRKQKQWFLLPLQVAKLLSLYTIEYREHDFLEEVLRKDYAFLDEDIKAAARHYLKTEQCKESDNDQRQMLLFFPMINYFSEAFPMVNWDYEGFLLFRAKGYWLSLEQLVALSVEKALDREKERYCTALFAKSKKNDKKHPPFFPKEKR